MVSSASYLILFFQFASKIIVDHEICWKSNDHNSIVNVF